VQTISHPKGSGKNKAKQNKEVRPGFLRIHKLKNCGLEKSRYFGLPKKK
jgi:hypothetical protein